MKKSQQSALRLITAVTLIVVASAGTAVTAQAAFIATATETGGDVVFTGSGSIDLTAWSYDSTHSRVSFVSPNEGVGFGSTNFEDDYISPTNFNGPSVIGPGTTLKFANGVSGDYTGLYWAYQTLMVPSGYISGQTLAGSMTFDTETFSSLGLTPGNYEWTWGSGASADSFTLNVGAVPIPAAVWLFGSGLLGLVGIARRKKTAL